MVEFLLLKNNIELIVLQHTNNASILSVLSSSNGRFDFNQMDQNKGLSKFKETISEIGQNDFFIFGDETKTLFAIKKSFVLSFVKVTDPQTLNTSYNIVDKQNNKYNIGINLSEEEFNLIIEEVLSY